MSSHLKVNTLSGVSTADSVAITTGATTTVLQKGMLKATLHLNSMPTTPVESESLNISSVDDDANGDFGLHFSNNFNTANYIMTTGANDGGASTAVFTIDQTYGTNTTSATDIETSFITATDNRSPSDGYGWMMAFCGDLA